MTRHLLLPSGARWTVSPLERSLHARADRRVWLSPESDVGERRIEPAAEGFDLARATEGELLELVTRDQWGLLNAERPRQHPEG